MLDRFNIPITQYGIDKHIIKTLCHKIYQFNLKTNEHIQGYYNSRLH